MSCTKNTGHCHCAACMSDFRAGPITSHKVKPYPYGGGYEKRNVWYDVSKVNLHVNKCHMIITDTLRIFAERYRDGECYKYRIVWRPLMGGEQQSEGVEVQSMDDAMSIAPIIARLA